MKYPKRIYYTEADMFKARGRFANNMQIDLDPFPLAV